MHTKQLIKHVCVRLTLPPPLGLSLFFLPLCMCVRICLNVRYIYLGIDKAQNILIKAAKTNEMKTKNRPRQDRRGFSEKNP